MTEERFEEFLRKTAQSYNAPPARAPREEMWQAIQTTRKSGPRVVYGAASYFRRTGENRFGSRVWWAAAAAVVLVASGVGIGRWTASPDAPATDATAIVPSTQSEIPAANDPSAIDPSADPSAVVAERGASRTGVSRGGSEGQPAAPNTVASTGSAVSAGSTASGSGTSPGAPSSAYQVAAANHLSQAEALLTSFKTRSATDQRLDAQLASWARELLSNTRLLLDSPVAVDPERRPLLQDLELLLVQIVQLSPGSTPQDREIIEQTLRQDHVLTRLRTAIPAGQRGS